MVGTVDSCTTGWRSSHGRAAQDLPAQLLEGLGVRSGTDHDALATRLVDGLDDEPSSRSSTSSRASFSSSRQVSTLARIADLAEVEADQVRHVGVDELVVGDAVADSVGEGDVAGLRAAFQRSAQPSSESALNTAGSRKSSSMRR